jgi:hypothetical protein
LRRFGWVLFSVLVAVILGPLAGPVADPQGTGSSAGHTQHGFGWRGFTAFAQTVACWPSATPLGALPPAIPIWCFDPPETGPATIVNGPNSWLDDFDHHLSNADLGPGYRIFETPVPGQGVILGQHFRHNEHWMVDLHTRDTPGGPTHGGGVLMRPDRSFRAVNGRLVIEADVAAGIQEYQTLVWPELIITTAPTLTGVSDFGYANGQFEGHWTVACRLHASQRIPICPMRNTNSRVWEVAYWQGEGAQIFGGGPFPAGGPLDRAWRVCQGTDPDLNCRDRFRMEITQSSLLLYVNGVRYFEASNFPADKQMAPLVNSDVYVYFASWFTSSDADTIRFHWDHLAVNPTSSPTPPPPSVVCSPRPRVTTTVVKESPGVLRATISATGANNTVRSVNFTPNGAIVRRAGFSDQTAPFSSTPQTASTSFQILQRTPGAAATVQLAVTDGCGATSTFVGGGPAAF